MAHLKTVPTFLFHQGNPKVQLLEELPIQVSYYHDVIELEQGAERVLINKNYFEALTKEVLKHKRDAELSNKLKFNK